MDKKLILTEIKRIALTNGGKPPGEKLFRSETGIKPHEWRGKFWARWGDALREAGYMPNEWIGAHEETFLIEKFIALTRELGRLPSQAELQMKRQVDPDFPSLTPFKSRGFKQGWIAKVLEYSRNHAGHEDIVALCASIPTQSSLSPSGHKPKNEETIGFVYLMKSGRYYKIGRSNASGRREYELAIQMPEKLATVHTIRTDDPVGIEAYWHGRFAQKRKNGEWFDLTSDDVSTFKRRKFM